MKQSLYSKRHYDDIAAMFLAQLQDCDRKDKRKGQIYESISRFAARFEQDNPRFNLERFFQSATGFDIS